MANRVLIVDDDPAVLDSLAEAVGELGMDATTAAAAAPALSAVASFRPDVVLCDVRLPDGDGFQLLDLLRERAPTVDVVLMTAFDDMPTAIRAMRDGALDFLVKPLDLDELREVLGRIMGDRRRAGRGAAPAQEGPTGSGAASTAGAGAAPVALEDPASLVGHDVRMIRVFKQIGRLAASRVTVLVRGETGTGKERVARAIHAHSSSGHEPFVAVNCTALPQPLLESELFGHVRGAFTGAHTDRVGRFSAAGEGTLFLDEIGDTTPEFQAKLLRVLEDGEYSPVGSDRTDRAQARIITATRRDLETRVEEGRFREDLYYRLRVAEIRLPPLRERRGDIAELALHLVRRAATAEGRTPPHLPEETLRRLAGYDWPGNVRELENCLSHAVAVVPGPVIRPEDLRLEAPAATPAVLRPLRAVEGEHVARVLAAMGGNKTRAAEVLGISRPTLYRLIEEHDLG